MKSLLLLSVCLTGCYQREIVQISPSTYAMDYPSFHAFEFRRHLATPEVWYGCDISGTAPAHKEMVEPTAQREGVYFPRENLIVIRAKDPYHLSTDETWKLWHESGHREDHTLYHDVEGSSIYWIYLATTPGASKYLTHPDINNHLHAEGITW